jgi:hypothetical protein
MVIAGCSQKPEVLAPDGQAHLQTKEPHGIAQFDTPTYVWFDLQPDGKQSETHWRYSAFYKKQGKTARFQIEFELNAQANGGIRSGRGSFVSEPDSDASVLLADLKDVLGAKQLPGRKVRVRALPFEVAILGEHQKREDDDSFVDADDGTWVAAKLFLKGGEEEVFLNFEQAGGKGEFAIKDSDYGDGVLIELAKVL